MGWAEMVVAVADMILNANCSPPAEEMSWSAQVSVVILVCAMVGSGGIVSR